MTSLAAAITTWTLATTPPIPASPPLTDLQVEMTARGSRAG
jgi:hypothetical protein